jgi:predicted methyltransferase
MDMMGSMAESGASSGSGWVGPAMQVGGTLLSAYGQKQSGSDAAATGLQQQQLANYQAAQLRVNAGEAIASSQRSAQDIQRQTDYVASRALAVAAASGGGASDPTVVDLIARAAGEGAYRRSVALYQGEDKARALNAQASATEYGGQLAAEAGGKTQAASDIGAASTLAKGGASLFSKYGAGTQPGFTPQSPTDAMTADNMSAGWF